MIIQWLYFARIVGCLFCSHDNDMRTKRPTVYRWGDTKAHLLKLAVYQVNDP